MAAIKLMIVDGPSRGKEFPLAEGETVLGRTNETPIELPSNKVSRRHAAIRVARGQVEIEDLNSSNGTYINGKRITKSAVPAGAKIVVGEYVLQVVNGGQGGQRAPQQGGARPAGPGKAMVVPQPGAAPGRQPRGPGGPAARGGRPSTTSGMAVPSEAARKAADRVVGKMGGVPWRMQVVLMSAFIGIAMMIAISFVVARTKSDFRELALGRARIVAQQLAAENATYLFLNNDLSLSGDATKEEDGVKDTLLIKKRIENDEVRGEIAFPQTLRGNLVQESDYAIIVEALNSRSFDVLTAPNRDNPAWTDIAAPVLYYDANDPVNPGFKLVGVGFVTFDPQVVADKATGAGVLYGISLAVIALACAAGSLLVIRATEPGIARLQEDTELVIRGNLEAVRPTLNMKEMEMLAHSINRLIQKAPQGRTTSDDIAAGRPPASPALALPAQAGPVDNAGASATVRALVSAIQDAVIVVDADSNVLEVNKPAEKLFGLNPARVRGKHLLEAITDQELLNTVLDVLNAVTAAPEGIVVRDAPLPNGTNGRISAAGVRQGRELAGSAIVFMALGGDA